MKHINNWIDQFIHDENLSEESVNAIHEFLTTLLYEFESTGLCRLSSYHKNQKEIGGASLNVPVEQEEKKPPF